MLLSLDHFRSRVYRQRLALLVLLILLSGGGSSSSSSSSSTPIRTASPASLELPVLSTQIPASLPEAFPRRLTSWLRSFMPSDESATTPKNPLWKTNGIVGMLVESTGASNQRATRHDTTTRRPSNKPATGLLGNASLPNLSLSLLLSPSIFPTLLQLHILWLIRFVSGEIEGRAGNKARDVRFWPTATLLLSLMIGIGITLLPQTMAVFRQWGQTLVPSQADQVETIFPSAIVLALEAIPTALSLVPLFIFLAPGWLPSRIKLQSPSHAPPLLHRLPSWLQAPFASSEQTRARRGAGRLGRRHGGFDSITTPRSAMPLPSQERQSGSQEDQQQQTTDDDGPTPATEHSVNEGTPLESLGATSREAAHVLRVQQELFDELERAGKLSASDRARLANGTSPATLEKLRRKQEKVSLPLLYVASVLLSIASTVSLILCYALITWRLPSLTPSSLSAVVALLALRAEIGSLFQYWSRERRRVEGLEFVRRRWGTSVSSPTTAEKYRKDDGEEKESCCGICLEVISWSDEEEDAVRLDCQHELHAVSRGR